MKLPVRFVMRGVLQKMKDKRHVKIVVLDVVEQDV